MVLHATMSGSVRVRVRVQVLYNNICTDISYMLIWVRFATFYDELLHSPNGFFFELFFFGLMKIVLEFYFNVYLAAVFVFESLFLRAYE